MSSILRPLLPPPARSEVDLASPVPVRGDDARALLAIAHATAVAPPTPSAREIETARGTLARDLSARFVGVRDASFAERLGDDAEVLTNAVRAVLGDAADHLPATLEEASDDLLAEAGYVLRVAGLEHHRRVVALAHDGERRLVALHAPATEAQAHVWLLEPLYERVEAWVRAHGPARREREACRWWFERWRAPRPIPGDDFARGVREQEFSLVERPYACLGATPLEHMVRNGLLGGAGPRERRLAAALIDSVAGVWKVESRIREDAAFRDPLDGKRWRVREHGPEDLYTGGLVALGRLIPFGEDAWLRSPGVLMLPSRSHAHALTLAEALAEARERLDPQVAVEAVLHRAAGARGLPRDVRPDATPDEAVELLKEIHQDLRDSGHEETADPETDPDARRTADEYPGMTLLRFTVDLPLGEYVAALFELSRTSRAVREARRRMERRRKRQKK